MNKNSYKNKIMIKVLISGINGKMGQEVFKSVEADSNFEVCAGFDKSDCPNLSVPVYTNCQEIVENPDVIIDFSVPEATFQILEFAKAHSTPIVIATTGFSDDQLKQIEDYAKEIPIFRSSNMSFEINIMCDIVAKLAKQLTNSDIEIVETHHKNKIDSPSGTAIMLADSINDALDNSMNYQYDRHSVRQKRDDKEIGIHSIRGGTEVGKHSVFFFGNNESFEITHTVNSRSIFANGSLKAAEFLVNQGPGYYNMKNLI